MSANLTFKRLGGVEGEGGHLERGWDPGVVWLLILS